MAHRVEERVGIRIKRFKDESGRHFALTNIYVKASLA